MKKFYQRILDNLTPGVRLIISLLALAYLVEAAGKLTRAYELDGWLTLSGQAFWHGQVWRLVTFALVPVGLTNFVMNCIALVILGGLVERLMNSGAFWMLCLTCCAAAGLAHVFMHISGVNPLAGAGPVSFGILAAWGYISGREQIQVPVVGQMLVWQVVLLAAGGSLIATAMSAGLGSAVTMMAAGLGGWGFVFLRQKRLMTRSSRTVHSERIHRLEL